MSRMAAKDRREELIAAAFRVMVRDGVVKTTTRAVVNEAKMPLGVFHYCFNSREELLQEVITRITDSGVAKARNVFEGEGDLGARIAGSLYAFWEELSSARESIKWGTNSLTTRCARRALRIWPMRQYEHYLEVHEQLLAEAAESAGIKWTVPLPVLARYLNAVLDGVTLCWLADRNSENTREVLRLTGEHLMSLAAKDA